MHDAFIDPILIPFFYVCKASTRKMRSRANGNYCVKVSSEIAKLVPLACKAIAHWSKCPTCTPEYRSRTIKTLSIGKPYHTNQKDGYSLPTNNQNVVEGQRQFLCQSVKRNSQAGAIGLKAIAHWLKCPTCTPQ